MPQQPQQKEAPSLVQQFQFAQQLAFIAALSPMVYLRSGIGFRMVGPIRLLCLTLFLFVVSVLAGPNPAARPLDLLAFAALMLILGTGQRIHRWWEMGRGAKQHSWFLGNSRLAVFSWVPFFLKKNRRLERFCDPLLAAAIGVLLLPYSRALALWLIASSACLRMLEDAIYRKELHERLDIVDGIVVSEIQTQTVEHFERPPVTRQQSASGIPTGAGKDIADHLKRQQSNQAHSQN